MEKQKEIQEIAISLLKEREKYNKVKSKVQKKFKGIYIHNNFSRTLKNCGVYFDEWSGNFYLPKRVFLRSEKIGDNNIIADCEHWSLFCWSSNKEIVLNSFLKFVEVDKNFLDDYIDKLKKKQLEGINQLQKSIQAKLEGHKTKNEQTK